MTRQSWQSTADTVRSRFRSPDRVLDGIPSYTIPRPGSDLLETDRLQRLLATMDSKPLYRALDDALTGFDGRNRFLKQVFRPGVESWRILVADAFEGSCLDLDAGFGTRPLLIAEMEGVEEVYAADEHIDPLRFLSHRSDYDTPGNGRSPPERSISDSTAPVYPVHADPESLPVPAQRFDTVVADLATISQWDDVRRRAARAAAFVGAEGTLVAPIDGPARLSGLTGALGIETQATRPVDPGVTDLPTAARATPSRYRTLFEKLGFSDVDLYALVPSTDDPQYGFPLSDPVPVVSLLSMQRVDDGFVTRLLREIARHDAPIELLQRWYPSFIAVCRRSETQQAGATGSSDDQRLVVRGRSRSVVLEHEGSDLRRIRKVPHRRAHAPFTTNERDIPEKIRAKTDSDWIRRTLPTGKVESSRFGPTYVESPAPGERLAQCVSSDPDDFRRVLSIGFEWLTEFHRSYCDAKRRVTGDEIRQNLSVPHLDLSPPTVPTSLTLFSTPAHGDFQPGNIYVDESAPGPRATDGSNRRLEISRVIDWEYAAGADTPITDAGFMTLLTAGMAFGGLYNGIRNAFIRETPHAEIVREVVGQYCAAVGIDPIAFQTYLPYVWIRRHQYCESIGATMHYTGHGQQRAAIIEFLWEHADEIRETLGIESASSDRG